jgi:CubicO group peptidase (beta-lactamase class C family)
VNSFAVIAAVCLLLAAVACQSNAPAVGGEGRTLTNASPEKAGFSAERLAAAVDLMRRAVEEGKVTGVQLLVARHARIAAHEALGLRDLESQLPMEKKTLLRMASVTKTVVSAGILMLADDGRLSLSDPVSRHVPGFSEGLSAQLTVQDLIRHSTGFPYTFKNYVGPITLKSPDNPDAPSLRVEARKIGKIGPEVEPGSVCQYSNQGYIVLGAVLESAAGQKLDDFLQDRLYRPLEMSETSHALGGVEQERVSLNYQWDDERWNELPPRNPPFARSTGGLVTTALDYAKFAQLYLDKGEYGGMRLLDSETVREAIRVQIECPYIFVWPDRLREIGLAPMWYYRRDSRELGLDVGFGNGWAIARNGAFSHGGYRGTFVLVDPAADMFILVFAQSRLGGAPGQEFIDAVYEAIIE